MTSKPLILRPPKLHIIMYLSFSTSRNDLIERIT